MALISGLISLLGDLESDKIAVHERRCIAVRNRNADCLRCAEACTSQAISYADNELKIDPNLCIGCGSCATACPTCAIEIKSPSDEELIQQIKSVIATTKGQPLFACETALEKAFNELELREGETKTQRRKRATSALSLDEQKICSLPCLGRIDEAVLIGLSAYKVSNARLICSDCESCEHAPGGRIFQEVLESAKNLLSAFDSKMNITLETKFPAEAYSPKSTTLSHSSLGTSRRDFFNSVKLSSTKAVKTVAEETLGTTQEKSTAPAYERINAQGTLSHFTPPRRLRVYNYLKQLGEPCQSTVSTRIIGCASINAELCNSCQMCAVFCPTGALEKIHTKEDFGLLNRPSLCMQCRLCESICPKGAMTIKNEVSIEQFIGKQAIKFSMDRPSWAPNKPDSLYQKVHEVIGSDLNMCSF